MRKAIAESKSGNIAFSAKALDHLHSRGYNFVQVKGFTQDHHYEYIEPHFLVLVPLKELPSDPLKKDIFEPITSELLYKWADETNEFPQIVIANNTFN
jgi:hypothetical protein